LTVDAIHEPIFYDLTPTPFSALRKLTIGAAPAGTWISFFSALVESPLAEIYGEASSMPEPKFAALLSAIHDHVSHDSLTTISIGLRRSEVDPDLHVLHSSTLRPLLAFHNLAVVEVDAFRVSFDDTFVEEMALAWPRLTNHSYFANYIVGEPSPPPSISLCALSIFAQHCPALHMLRLPVNGAIVPDPPHPVEWPSQRALTSLHVVDSPIESALAVAGVLSCLFPCLEELMASDEGDEDNAEIAPADAEVHARWKEVERLVPMFVKIREEEGLRVRRVQESGSADSAT
jgi:hypothetical protein